jgi:hypothetical protein
MDLVKALESAYRDSGGHPAAPPQPAATSVSASGLRVLENLSPGTSAAKLNPVSATPSILVDQPAALRPGRPSRLPFLVLAVVSVVAVGVALLRPWEQAQVKPLDPLAVIDAGAPLVAVGDFDAGAPEDDAGLVVAAGDVDAGADEDVDGGALAEAGDGGRTTHVAVKKRGQLKVLTTHAGEPYWAQVSIDGVARGRTPLMVDLLAGRFYQVRVERPGFQVQERRVLVAAGKPVVVKIDLVP